MKDLENTYICFRTEALYFIISIFGLVRILSSENNQQNESSSFRADTFGEIPIIDFCKGRDTEQSTGTILVLQEEGKQFGIYVEKVECLIEISAENQYDLPPMLCGHSTRYLNGIAYWPEKEKILLLLNESELLQVAEAQKE